MTNDSTTPCATCGKAYSSGSHAKSATLGGHQHWFGVAHSTEARTPALDVERLAYAMSGCDGVNWPKRWEPEDFAWVARQVAAEYRLLTPDQGPESTTKARAPAQERRLQLVTEADLQWALETTHKRFPLAGLLDDLDPVWVAYTLMARLRERESGVIAALDSTPDQDPE